MDTHFDLVRNNYATLQNKEFSTDEQKQEYINKLTSIKDVGDAIAETRTIDSYSSMASTTTYLPITPTNSEDCKFIHDEYCENLENDALSDNDYKFYLIQAIIYIHWDYCHLKFEDNDHEIPSKLSLTVKITNKIIKSVFDFNYTMKTSIETTNISINHTLNNLSDFSNLKKK